MRMLPRRSTAQQAQLPDCPSPTNPFRRAQLDFVLARQAQLQLIWDQHLLSTGAAHSSNGSSMAAAGNGVAPGNEVAAPVKEVVTV